MKNKEFINKLLIFAGAAIFIYAFIVNAWLCDDAFITLRVVDNFINGYGLRWNVAERVQVFTGCLWTFLISFFYFFTREPYFTLLIISLFLNLALLIVVFLTFKKYFEEHFSLRYFLFIILLVSSKAFIDYTSSGLETPLGYLIIGIFFSIFLFKIKDFSAIKNSDVFLIFLLASLGFLTRPDYILIFFPALVFVFIKYNKKPTWGKTGLLLAGVAPAVLWILFSLIYYGFPFPNTFYAKLNIAGVSLGFLSFNGAVYYQNSLAWDPPTLFFILMALILSIKNRRIEDWLAAAGIILYLLCIWLIGGDFMSGRFFAIVFLIAALLSVKNLKSKNIITVLIVLLFLFILSWPKAPIKTTPDYYKQLRSAYGVSDEKVIYFKKYGLINRLNDQVLPVKPNQPGLFKKIIKNQKGRNLLIWRSGIGYFGYVCGPGYYIVDVWALSDALLARIPGNFLITGHVERSLPPGYIKSIELSGNLIEDPDLKVFYDKLRPIISGPLFTRERLKDIFYMNIGKYNYLVRKYFEKLYPSGAGRLTGFF